MKKKILIINADDFAMNEEVNEGIKLGVKRKIVTSVSVMANMPYFEDAIKFLKKNPQISVGLHFNITEGRPLISSQEAGNLSDKENNFYFWSKLIVKLILQQVTLASVRKELEAQYHKLTSSGIRLTHFDSHHHIHLYPPLFKMMSEFASEKKIPFIRGKNFSSWNLTLRRQVVPVPTQLVVNTLLFINSKCNKKVRCLSEDTFYDINWGKDMTSRKLGKIVTLLPEGITLLICHISLEGKRRNDSFFAPRYRALQLLSDPLIKKYLSLQPIILSSTRYEEKLG